ncbi:MAG TPA: thiolase domain-containing protein [Candidatus Methanoperedens sp.]|nr:thiolase domain-containing protein [Candidatus Methanoperedens sp.]
MNITIAGCGQTKFGELWESSPRSLARQAVFTAIADSGVNKKSIQAIFVSNMLSEMLGMQSHLGALFAEELGISVPAYTIEGACASGGLAVHSAINSLLSQRYDTVLVLGVEKMTDHSSEYISSALMGAGSNEERLAGATFPGLYALLARAHMEKYGTTESQLASVSVKNHFHASLNPLAQFSHPLTLDQVMRSSYVATPLKLLDCSPISDGAAAIILQRSPTPKKNTVEIIASEIATDTLGLANRNSLTELQSTRKAAKNAFTSCGIAPSDIDIAEVHDCFSIAEILAIEDIAFDKKGEVAKKMEQGEYRLDTGQGLVVNSSGGLKGCGHPIGATGVKQIIEIYNQLHGQCKDRQVKNARLGLTHNVGGTGATAVIHILKKHD